MDGIEGSEDFLKRILKRPSYGYVDASNGPVRPNKAQILKEFFSNYNILKDRKNWLIFFIWSLNFLLETWAISYLLFFFNPLYVLFGLIYALIIVPSHTTLYYHRFCVHKAFKFKNKFWTYFVKHLVIEYFPDELYVPSHHVHHKYPDQNGDPYNAASGAFLCFFADANQTPIRSDLTKEEYSRVRNLMNHCAIKKNDYESYLKWGTISNPADLIVTRFCNWTFWIVTFYYFGGWELVGAMFACITFPVWGLRLFNFQGHGKGEDKRIETDFCRDDLSINSTSSAYFAGEWHNNHHLYPRSARAGFLPGQLDLPFLAIKLLHIIGIVDSYRDDKEEFLNIYVYEKNEALALNQLN